VRTVLSAVAKKEILEFLRYDKTDILSVIAMPVIMQWFLLLSSIKTSLLLPGEHARSAPTVALMYVPLLLIPFLGNALLRKSFDHEKATGAILPTLATGINPGILWATKTITMFCCCYLVSMVVLQFDILIMTFYFNAPIVFALNIVILILLTAPILALATMALFSFLHWMFKLNGLVSSLAPVGGMAALYYLGGSHLSKNRLMGGTVLIVLATASIFCLCGIAISRMSRRRILSL